ncbi:MAG TPA: DUF3261 domain-containing protein [Candidatus Binatia bacterium]|nr:DUF3261 domain-containing protein [Candidatus Binatia bacterium]
MLIRAALLSCALLAACAAPGAGRPAAMPVLPVLSPASYGRSAQLEQVLHAAFGAQEASLQCIVGITPQRLTVLGLTALGQRVFSLEYDGTALKAERSPLAPDQVQPERILADLQFALWPLSALQAATTGSPWKVSEPRPGLRRLAYGEQLVAELHRADQAGIGVPARLWLSALRDGYALDIETREAAP